MINMQKDTNTVRSFIWILKELGSTVLLQASASDLRYHWVYHLVSLTAFSS